MGEKKREGERQKEIRRERDRISLRREKERKRISLKKKWERERERCGGNLNYEQS